MNLAFLGSVSHFHIISIRNQLMGETLKKKVKGGTDLRSASQSRYTLEICAFGTLLWH